MLIQAYEEQYPKISARAEPIDWDAYEPKPVVHEPRQGGHPYRGGPPDQEPPKSPWRAFWERLKGLLS